MVVEEYLASDAKTLIAAGIQTGALVVPMVQGAFSMTQTWNIMENHVSENSPISFDQVGL